MTHVCRALVLIALFAAPLPAQAPSPAEASREYTAGQAAQQQSNWKQALEHYQRSYLLAPHHATAYNMGVCYEHLAQARQAVAYFQLYLRTNPAAEDAALVAARIAQLKARPSRVTFVADGPSGVADIDNGIQLRMPATVELGVGAHHVRAVSGGETTTFALEYGEPQTIRVKTLNRTVSFALEVGLGYIKRDILRDLSELTLSVRGRIARASAYAWQGGVRTSNLSGVIYTQNYLSLGLGTYQRTGWQHHAALAVGYDNQPTWLLELRAGVAYGWYRYVLWTVGLETGFAGVLHRTEAQTPTTQLPFIVKLGVAY